MLTIVGDDELDIIELPNNMKINMAFGIDETVLTEYQLSYYSKNYDDAEHIRDSQFTTISKVISWLKSIQ